MTAATIVFLLAGLAALAGGGEILVRGATSLARTFGLSTLVIGLTVVSFATSAPELAVTLQASLRGNPGLAIGNVVGSNIANVLLILGVCAVVLPLAVRSQIIRLDIPVVVVVSALALLLALDGSISRAGGGALIAVLLIYLVGIILLAKRPGAGEKLFAGGNPAITPPAPAETGRRIHPLLSLGLVAVGVGLLVVGARLLVSGATDVASALGISDLVIGLTVVSIGTSLPELAASLVAALRGERDLAVGNIVGSCLFNLGAVLGITAVLTPGGIPVASAAVRFDLPVMIAVTLVLVPVAFTGFTIVRWEGTMFVAYYAAYIAYLLLNATGHDAVEPFSGVMLGFVIPITVFWLGLLVAYELGVRRGRRDASSPPSGTDGE